MELWKRVLGDDVRDAAVKSLDEAVGLGVARRAEAMLDAQSSATHVEGMFVAGGARLLLEAIGEAGAVVGEQLDDAHRSGVVQSIDEVDGTVGFHVGVNADEDPARSPIDGYVEVAALCLVGHLRQVLDVDVYEAWFVVLEGLGFSRRSGVVA